MSASGFRVYAVNHYYAAYWSHKANRKENNDFHKESFRLGEAESFY